jgi:hypothetical protein
MWSADTSNHGWCDGWTQTEADVTAMLREIHDAIRLHQAEYMTDAPPLRLEISPLAHGALMHTLVPASPGPDGLELGAGGDLSTLLGTPIVQLRDLPPGRWRLVVPGPVLASGTVAT